MSEPTWHERLMIFIVDKFIEVIPNWIKDEIISELILRVHLANPNTKLSEITYAQICDHLEKERNVELIINALPQPPEEE